MKFEVTFSRFGTAVIEAGTEDEALELAESYKDSDIEWDDGFCPTDVEKFEPDGLGYFVRDHVSTTQIPVRHKDDVERMAISMMCMFQCKTEDVTIYNRDTDEEMSLDEFRGRR